MTLSIHSDIEYKHFEVVTKDERFSRYPLAGVAGWNNDTYFTYIDKNNWWKDLREISRFVEKEFQEECLFKVE